MKTHSYHDRSLLRLHPLPNLLFPILKTTADEGTGENRSLAAFPTLSLETIDTFPSGVED